MLNVSIVLYNHSLSGIAPLVEKLWKSELVSAVFEVEMQKYIYRKRESKSKTNLLKLNTY